MSFNRLSKMIVPGKRGADHLSYGRAAGITLMAALAAGCALPALAQLPNTVMGRTVGQPGDNQYSPKTQLTRHTNYIDRTNGQSYYIKDANAAPPSGGAGGASFHGAAVDPMALMYSNRPKVDVSIEPIAADEPIPEAGFPPLPDHIQLPVQPMGDWGSRGGGTGGGGYAGGGGGGRAPVTGPIFEGMHEHYAHTAPGSFVLPHGGTGGGGGGGGGAGYAVDPNAAVPGYSPGGAPHIVAGGPSQSLSAGVLPQHGYYKVTNAPTPVVDTYNSNSGGGGGVGRAGGSPPPRYAGPTSNDVKKMGQAPKLDDDQDKPGQPDAPQAALVSQSQAVDLSLPDDEFVSRYGLKDGPMKTFGKKVARQAGYMLYSGAASAASRAYSVVP